MVKYVSTYTKGTLRQRSVKDLSNVAYVMFLCFLFLIFFKKHILQVLCCGYSFELQLHRQVNAFQMGTPTYAFIKK